MSNFDLKYNNTPFILIIIILVILILYLFNENNSIEKYDILDLDKEISDKLTYVQKIELIKLLKIIHKELSENNIFYCICGGSLLGAIRHKNIIPWDYNGNVFILQKDIDIFESINWNKYGCSIYKNLNGYKLYFTDGKQSYENNIYQKWNYPYININVFFEKDNKIIPINQLNQNLKQINYFDKSELFPLKQYQLDDVILYGPNNPYPYLNGYFGIGWEIYGKAQIDVLTQKNKKNNIIEFSINRYLKKNDMEFPNYLWFIGNYTNKEKEKIINSNGYTHIPIFINNDNLNIYLDGETLKINNKENINIIKKKLFDKYGGNFL